MLECASFSILYFRVAEIEKTRLFVDIKLVLSKYNLTGFNVSRNLASVDILVKLILSKGRSDALKDALTVGTFFKRLSEVDVYLMQFRIWLGLGRVNPFFHKITCIDTLIFATTSGL